MTKLDKYILSEFVGPFIFGLGVFFGLLVGVDLLYDAMRYMIREHIPASVVVAAIGYRIPMVAALTVPMATMFASLMAFARLSNDGELTAMRVGGASLPRIGAPVLVLAALMSALLLTVSHTWIPYCNGRSRLALVEYRKKGSPLEHLILRIPRHGPLERIIYIDRLDPRAGVMQWVVLVEFRERQWVTLVAERATWNGRIWRLQNVEHTTITPQGTQTEKIAELECDIGRAPLDLERVNYDLDELSTAELRRELAVVTRGPAHDATRAAEVRTEIQFRWSTPWSVLGFALVGVALGIRPQRTSRGVALGLSLAVILAYYIVMHTMSILGEQGRLPAFLCAWSANLGLYLAGGIGLFGRE